MRSFAIRAWPTRRRRLFDPALFDGDENAIVDFKYSSDPRLTWWFDHHQSAFLNAEDAEHFRRDTSGRKLYDPSYKSCTSFICARGARPLRLPRAGPGRPGALVADHRRRAVSGRPDGRGTGRAGDEADAGDRSRQRLATSCRRSSAGCSTGSLSEIIAEPEIQALYEPLYQRHLESIDIIRGPRAAGRRRGVLRSGRLRHGRLQQVHPVLPVSARLTRCR